MKYLCIFFLLPMCKHITLAYSVYQSQDVEVGTGSDATALFSICDAK